MLRPGRWKSPRVRSSACYLWQVFLFHFISTWNDSKQIHAITSWTFTRTQLTQHIIFIFVKKGDVPIPSQKYKEHYLKNTDLYLSWFPLDTLQKNVRIQSPTIKVSNSGYLGLHATTLNLFSYIYIYFPYNHQSTENHERSHVRNWFLQWKTQRFELVVFNGFHIEISFCSHQSSANHQLYT